MEIEKEKRSGRVCRARGGIETLRLRVKDWAWIDREWA